MAALHQPISLGNASSFLSFSGLLPKGAVAKDSNTPLVGKTVMA